MEYRVLGPLEVLAAGGEKLALGGAMQQSVLASLVLRAGQTVALERLIDDLWDEPPETAARTVQAYVSRLRHELPKGAIESRPGGYRLVLDGGIFDLETFERRAEEGHSALAAGRCEEAGRLLRSALALWRGPALAGLTSEALRRQAEQLEELRLTALEDRLAADLGCAREAEIVPELKTLVAEHPFRERLRAQLMRALYRSGRPGEALALYRETRRVLVDELGMEPGQELRELEQAILRQDAELEAPTPRRSTAPAEPVPVEREPRIEQPPLREVRKTVTILFCDIVDSTARGESTDPEVMRTRLARFFEQMKTIVERHGGTVEKFIGDAVMAVFGVPRAHEDDALRGCRAAIEMREALPSLGIEGRIGLMTGEVVTGTEERLVTGDPVNVAARLEHAAGPGEVLIGEPTLELVRGAVEVDALEPLELKGKAQLVEAYRLKAVHEPREQRRGAPIVGRETELAHLAAAFDRAVAARSCELVTIVGEAGVGKSRLVGEFLSGLEAEAMVAVGRCLPYGEGITYWPVVEVLKRLRVQPSERAAAAAIGSLLGKGETDASAEEIAWAFRQTLEQAAAARPLVVVFDDIQWGEQTFLDLIEHVGLLSSDAPILLLCMARPELTERRSGWPVALRLEPLPEEAVQRLIPKAIGTRLRERIARVAGGNPLFVEEMAAMALEARGEVAVPATLRALLAARLDQLDPGERRVLECAAVEGEIFHRGALVALAGGKGEVTPRLAALVRRGVISPDRAQLAGEDGFRFRHLLIRDAAYEALTKTSRAELHQGLAGWLEQRSEKLVELDELLGYHLEQAARYTAELGQRDAALAERAAEHLAAAGRRALWRVDEPAAAALLGRALELTRPLGLDVQLELDLVEVFLVADPKRAAALAEAAAEQAQAAGDEAGEALARVVAAEKQIFLAADSDPDQLEALAVAALSLLEQAGDHAGLARVWGALAFGVANHRGRLEEMAHAAEQAVRHARLAGEPPLRLPVLALALVAGPRPADEALRALDEALPENPRPPEMMLRGVLVAMLGRFDEAWDLARAANERLRALRGSSEELWLAEIAQLEGDYEAAEHYLRRSFEAMQARGMRNTLSGLAPLLARVLCARGRHNEAEPLARLGRELAAESDVWAQTLWRQAQALVDAALGKHAEAERLAREAVAVAERTDGLNLQADALYDLAEVLAAAGRTHEAAAALELALERYERKKNLAMVARARARLPQLRRSLASAKRA
jgi:class 3 adenylate cyclase/tetratricopeptide (TPR) repeat protein